MKANKKLPLLFFYISYNNLSICFITYKIVMETFLAFKRDTSIGVNPTPYSGIMTFCDSLCFEPSKK